MNENERKRSVAPEREEDIVIADMNIEGMPGYRPEGERKKKEEMESMGLTKAERRAMIRGAYRALLPIFFTGLLIFCLAYLIIMIYFRLNM